MGMLCENLFVTNFPPARFVSTAPTPSAAPPARKRPAKGERRLQILQTLAAMLEQPGGERVTTAALAARLQVSEAALYRHFASKAQMLEGLIDYIEDSLLGLVRQIHASDATPQQQAVRVVVVVLQFAERNPSMARLMVGDALALEHERLHLRMARLLDKLEAALRQCLRPPLLAGDLAARPADSANTRALATLLSDLMLGRLQRFVRSGFQRLPTAQLQDSLNQIHWSPP